VAHENLFYSTAARFDYYKSEPENFLLLSSFSFDSSVAGIFWTLTTGGNLVVTERRIEQDLEGLAEIIESERITHTLILPTLYSLLLDNIPAEKMVSLDTVIVAGEACSVSVCNKHFEKLPEAKLCNEYGPTEATVWATAHRIGKKDIGRRLIPIGKPVANTRIHILDKNKNLVPVGVTGEIHISGKGVVKGYFNNSGLSENSFIQNPFSKEDSGKMYRTGDLGRYRSDGTIEFLGRVDDQVKIRGFRIEPGEIQETIKAHPKIKDAIVKLESFQSHSGEIDRAPTDFLSESLQKLRFEEATEILESVENLSEREVEFILSEMESE
jgi:amino acid adenylation domain-containing protein